jgi:hypothetical protein
MRTVLILALTVAMCMCSDNSSEAEFEKSMAEDIPFPDVSSSQKPDDNQESVGGSPEWCKGMTLVEEEHRRFLVKFRGHEEDEIEKMCGRFEEVKEDFLRTLDNARPSGEGLFLPSDRRARLECFSRYILLGPGSFLDEEMARREECATNRVAKRAYSSVASFATKFPVRKTVKELLDALREANEQLWWPGCNDSQYASKLSEGSQRNQKSVSSVADSVQKENEEGATETGWKRMTWCEQAYHIFADRFWGNGEAELQGIHNRLKDEEEKLNRILNIPQFQRSSYIYVLAEKVEERRVFPWKESLKRIFCDITGLLGIPEVFIEEQKIREVYLDITSFIKSRPKDEKHEEVIGAMRKIFSELAWDLDKPKDTSELASTDQEACEGGEEAAPPIGIGATHKIFSELEWDHDDPKDTSELASTDQEACEGGEEAAPPIGIGATHKIFSEVEWDHDDPKDTSELASTDQEACEGGEVEIPSSSSLSVV